MPSKTDKVTGAVSNALEATIERPKSYTEFAESALEAGLRAIHCEPPKEDTLHEQREEIARLFEKMVDRDTTDSCLAKAVEKQVEDWIGHHVNAEDAERAEEAKYNTRKFVRSLVCCYRDWFVSDVVQIIMNVSKRCETTRDADEEESEDSESIDSDDDEEEDEDLSDEEDCSEESDDDEEEGEEEYDEIESGPEEEAEETQTKRVRDDDSIEDAAFLVKKSRK
jgi:hypothetical protein